MIEAGHGGKIINIASMDALIPFATLPHYNAAKAGVVALTKTLAKELGPYGILVNAVAPGPTDTPATRGITIMAREGTIDIEKVIASRPRPVLGRMGTPDDIAKVVYFLASGLSDYMTGSLVVVDGGSLLF